MKIILFCWNCGEEYNSSELPDMQLYYKGEVDSLYFSCNKCDGQVRSRTGKVIIKMEEK